MKKVYCDMCGKLRRFDLFSAEHSVRIGSFPTPERFDICWDCCDKLIKFIKFEKARNKRDKK